MLHQLCLSFPNNVDILVFPPFLHDGSISPEALVLEVAKELLEFMFLPLDFEFGVAKEEDLGENGVFEPNCPHPLETVGCTNGNYRNDCFRVEY